MFTPEVIAVPSKKSLEKEEKINVKPLREINERISESLNI